MLDQLLFSSAKIFILKFPIFLVNLADFSREFGWFNCSTYAVFSFTNCSSAWQYWLFCLRGYANVKAKNSENKAIATYFLRHSLRAIFSTCLMCPAKIAVILTGQVSQPSYLSPQSPSHGQGQYVQLWSSDCKKLTKLAFI